MYYVIIISLFVTILGYIFSFGKVLEYTVDETNGENIGLLGSGGLYTGSLGIALLPIIIPSLKTKKIKYFLYFNSIILYIFILLNVRRTAILIPVVGILTYLIFSPKKTKTLLLIITSFLLLFYLSPFYKGLLEKRFIVREESGKFDEDFYEKESRYWENIYLFDEIISFKDPLKSIFGYGNNAFAEHIKNNKTIHRMYHTDTAKLLSGGGILGFLLYILIYIQLFSLLNIKCFFRDDYTKSIRAGAYSLIMISIFVSLNGSLTLITFRSVLFLYLGALISIYHDRIYSIKLNTFNT